MQRFATTVWIALSLGLAFVCVSWCGVDAAQATEQEATATPARQQLAATITAFEITRHHAQQWESNEAARTLVKQMMDDIASSAKLNATWQSRFLTQEADDPDEQRDVFERTAIEELSAGDATAKQVWSRDQQRVVSRVLADRSCTNCHDVAVGNVLAYVSLRLRAVEQ